MVAGKKKIKSLQHKARSTTLLCKLQFIHLFLLFCILSVKICRSCFT